MVQTEQLLDTVTRSSAWAWMQREYLQCGPACPACEKAITGQRALDAWHDLRKVYCASCGHTFRPTSGTPIHETSWQPEEFVQLLFLMAAGRQVAQIAASLGKSTGCIRDMLDRIRIRHGAAVSGDDLYCEAHTSQG